jgi:hypothetical protein
MRAIAQNRLTAVGRVEASVLQMTSNSGRSSSVVVAVLPATPSATPMAAETPIAGAPRTTMVVMMSAVC